VDRKAIVTIVLILLALGAATGAWFGREMPPARLFDAADLPAPCRKTMFEEVNYVVCEIDLRSFQVAVAFAGEDGVPYGSLAAFDKAAAARGRPVLLSLNAGMYHKDLSPVGLLVEDGREVAPVNSSEGEGNFFLKPNGIFLIREDGGAAVMETGAFLATRPTVKYATQSGPMLVIGGKLHPRFLPDGTSRFTRNGVGVAGPQTVILAISLSAVSLGSFARLFRDELHCSDALFLDGDISSLSNGSKVLLGGTSPVGPILAVR